MAGLDDVPHRRPERRDRSLSPDVGTMERDRRARSRSQDRKRRYVEPSIFARETKRIFVDNLPWSMSWKDLKDYIMDEINEECYVKLHEDEFGTPKGSGTCDFRRDEGAQLAIEKLHRREVKGRKIIVRRETVEDRERAQPRNRPELDSVQASVVSSVGPEVLSRLKIDPHSITNSVFVANLPFKATAMKLKEVFSLAGKVVGVDIRCDNRGRSMGYGLVDFDTPFGAVQAISMFNGQALFDRKMEVRMDHRAMPPPGPPPPQLPEGLSGIGAPLETKPMPPQDLRAGHAVPNDLGILAGPGGPLAGLGTSGLAALGQLGITASALSTLGDLSSLQSLSSLGSILSDRKPSPPRGIGLGREFDSLGTYAGGRRDDFQRDEISRDRYERDCTVLVKNIPYEYSWQNLKDRFKMVGGVEYVKVEKNLEGTSRGMGTVKFATPEDARRAIALMDGTMMDRRRIVVRLSN